MIYHTYNTNPNKNQLFQSMPFPAAKKYQHESDRHFCDCRAIHPGEPNINNMVWQDQYRTKNVKIFFCCIYIFSSKILCTGKLITHRVYTCRTLTWNFLIRLSFFFLCKEICSTSEIMRNVLKAYLIGRRLRSGNRSTQCLYSKADLFPSKLMH